MKLGTLVFAAILMALAPSAQAEPKPSLKNAVIVDGQYIHLGDLFENAGKNAQATVAYAPRPGHRAVFDATWLYNVAHAFGLKWRPLTMQTQATVERTSHVIRLDEIQAAVRQALTRHGVGKDVEVDLSNSALRLYVAGDKPATVGVEGLIYDEVTGRFTATLAAPAGDASAQRTRVTGRVYPMVQIPVLAERKRASDIIEKRDIKWVDVRESRVSRDTVVEPEDLIGMAARRTLLADSPIRGRDVRRPVMVPKGSLVMMVLRTPYMRLTVKAKALEDGAKGDAIRVANLQSKTIVEAVVTGAGEVSVSPQSPRVALK